ncbi:MAG: hypothetical protein KDE31_26925 [Caldilineaceae bacterium]|nr:hypothetical protein [Caldilineaceae bacterium]
MIAEFTRDAAATAAVFGLLAASWFGWAQENPPPVWRNWLIAGAILSLVVALVGGFFTWQHWSAGTAFNPQTGRTFGLIVGIEFAIAGIGAGLLSWWGRSDLIAPWVALVVGVHFVPLAPLLHYRLLYAVAALVCVVALAAVSLASMQNLAVSAVTGVTTGMILLVAALFSLITVIGL